jgi:hypothetical protein
MKLRYRWPTLLAALLVIAVNGWLWSLPRARIVEGPPPHPPGEQHMLLEPGLVLRQTLSLPVPAPRDVKLRVWVQRVTAQQPFLRIRGESHGQDLGAAILPLAPADGAFHMRQAAWWHLPATAKELTVVIEGHGMRIATTAVDRVAGGSLEINQASQAPSDLALQLLSGDLGIERYLPLTAITDGKPGLLAWFRYPLALFSLYLILMASLLRSPRRLLRWVEDAAGASVDHLPSRQQP